MHPNPPTESIDEQPQEPPKEDGSDLKDSIASLIQALSGFSNTLGALASTLGQVKDALSDHPAASFLVASGVTPGDGAVPRSGPDANANLSGGVIDVPAMCTLCMFLNIKVHKIILDTSSPKKEAFLKDLEEFFALEEFNIMLYYTGHGYKGTGNWCFADGNSISFDEVFELWKKKRGVESGGTRGRLFIITDSCFSGKWVKQGLEKGYRHGIYVQASSRDNEISYENQKGGYFTKWFVSQSLKVREIFLTKEKVNTTDDKGIISSPTWSDQHPTCTHSCGFRFKSRSGKKTSTIFFGGETFPDLIPIPKQQPSEETKSAKLVPIEEETVEHEEGKEKEDHIEIIPVQMKFHQVAKEEAFPVDVLPPTMTHPNFNTDKFIMDTMNEEQQKEEDETKIPIDECVRQGCCTHKITSDKHFLQKFYHCKQCELVDGLGFCESCKQCHLDHTGVYEHDKPVSCYCDCGARGKEMCKLTVNVPNEFPISECIEQECCTYQVTGKRFAGQKFFHCKQCEMEGGIGFCQTCLNICHAGHEGVYEHEKSTNCFCDCGERGRGFCKAVGKTFDKSELSDFLKTKSSVITDRPIGILFEPPAFSKRILSEKLKVATPIVSIEELQKLSKENLSITVVYVREGTPKKCIMNLECEVCMMSDLAEALKTPEKFKIGEVFDKEKIKREVMKRMRVKERVDKIEEVIINQEFPLKEMKFEQ